MSVDFSAKLIYGVLLEEDEKNNLISKDIELLDKNYDFIHRTDYYDSNGDIVIGIKVDSVSAGETTEVDVSDPNVDELLDFLDELGIKQEPTWHLVCCVS